MKKCRLNFFSIISIVLLALTLAFYLSPITTNAESNKDNQTLLTEEELQQLKDEGIIGQEVTLDDLVEAQLIPEDDYIEEIDPLGDNLDYHLTTDKNGNLIDTFDRYSPFAIAYFYPDSMTSARSGDILITNNTVSSGILGHAGIVTSDGLNYASIRNSKSNPEVNSLHSWFEDYPNTKVIRINDSSKANLAGTWAKNYVKNNPNADYGITLAINSLDPTYCSKIVWQAYAKTSNAVGTASTTIKAPYGFLKKSNYKNGVTAKLIYQQGSDFGSGDF